MLGMFFSQSLLLYSLRFPYFDHNGVYPRTKKRKKRKKKKLLQLRLTISFLVSSLIAQGTEFPLRKPSGFHWDLFLLGLNTFVAGLLGIPFPNGLIPQAPFHPRKNIT